MSATTENLPLDTRLLSDAIIELNISRHNVSTYPRNHPIVEKSLTLAFGYLKKLFELRREITLAIAKDTLIIDDCSLDKQNPVYRDFALCLSRMNIACIKFIQGLSENEIYSFHSFILNNAQHCSPEDIQKSFDEYKLKHIKIKLIDYAAFSFTGENGGQFNEDGLIWERYIFGLLEGSLQTGEMPDALQGMTPGKLAVLINSANLTNIKEESYDRVITSYVRSSSERAFSDKELKKLLDFINGLRPELKREFLSSSVNMISKDLASVSKSLGDMSADDVIDFLILINEQSVSVPKALKNVLDKFSSLHEGSFQPARYGGGLIEHDIVLSDEITGLLEDANFKTFVTDSYQQEIQKLLEFDAKKNDNAWTKEFEKEWNNEYIDTIYHQIILTVVTSDNSQITSQEDYEYLTNVLKYHVEKLIDTSQYKLVLTTLNTLHSSIEKSSFPDMALKTLEYYGSEKFIAIFINSLRLMNREMKEEAIQLCRYYEEKIIPHLIDALIDEESQTVRRFLISLIACFNEKAVPEALKRLDDDRWFVKRNMLFILNECSGVYDLKKIRAHCDNENPKIRFEAIRCLLKASDNYGVELLKKDLNSKGIDSVKKAAVLSGAFKVNGVVPDLIKLLEKRTLTGMGFEDKIPVVRALSQIGDCRALNTLKKILSVKSLIFKSSLEKLKEEIYGSLKGYDHEAANELMVKQIKQKQS